MAIIHSKLMTIAGVEVELAIPNDSLGIFVVPAGERSVYFEARDATGRAWPFRLSTRTKGTSLKTTLSDAGGWLAFARDEGLKRCDKIIFFGEPNESKELRFRIQMQSN